MKFDYKRGPLALKITKAGVVVRKEGVSPVIHPFEDVLQMISEEKERRDRLKKPLPQSDACGGTVLNMALMCASSFTHAAACLLVFVGV